MFVSFSAWLLRWFHQCYVSQVSKIFVTISDSVSACFLYCFYDFIGCFYCFPSVFLPFFILDFENMVVPITIPYYFNLGLWININKNFWLVINIFINSSRYWWVLRLQHWGNIYKTIIENRCSFIFVINQLIFCDI